MERPPTMRRTNNTHLKPQKPKYQQTCPSPANNILFISFFGIVVATATGSAAGTNLCAQCSHFGLQPVTDSRGALGALQMQDAKRLTGIRERGDAPFGLRILIFQCFRGSLLRYLGTLFFVSCLDILETSNVKAGGLVCNDHQRRATCNFSRLEPQKVKYQ